MIPGGNLLNQAFKLIAKQPVTYYANTGRTINAVGLYEPSYAAPVNITGSFQPTPSNEYEQHGLDFNKSYFTLYTVTDVIPVGRNVSGDLLEFNGKMYQCESAVQWQNIDGWKSIFCVETNANEPAPPGPDSPDHEWTYSKGDNRSSGSAGESAATAGRGANHGGIPVLPR